MILTNYKCFLFLNKIEIYFWKHNHNFSINGEYIINQIKNENNNIEIFYINETFFALTSSKNTEIIFLHFEDNYLNKYRWGKKVKISCSKTKNYLIKINEKNLLFGNNNLRELIIIYVPTGEIVTKYESGILSSIFKINVSIYICSNKNIEEIDFKKICLSEVESNNKTLFNNISLIKQIQKGYYSFCNPSKFMICK